MFGGCDLQGIPSVPPCGACDWIVFGTGSAPVDGVSSCNGYLWVFGDWLVIGKEYPVCHLVGHVIG